VSKPLYTLPEERNFFELRKWFRQFYPEAMEADDDTVASIGTQ